MLEKKRFAARIVGVLAEASLDLTKKMKGPRKSNTKDDSPWGMTKASTSSSSTAKFEDSEASKPTAVNEPVSDEEVRSDKVDSLDTGSDGSVGSSEDLCYQTFAPLETPVSEFRTYLF